VAPVPESATLRVLTDNGYGRLLVASLVPRYLEHYPASPLQVEPAEHLPLEPQPGESYAPPDWDVLICNQEPSRPELTATLLGRPPLILCATPAYLRQAGIPAQPAELAHHALLLVAAKAPERLQLRRGTQQVAVPFRPQLVVSDPALVHASAAAGLGIGLLPEFLCRQGLALGRLERVLPDWQPVDALALYAVYGAQRAASEQIRRFVDFLLANMAPALGKAA
jgi:DNA-binding transcriptional LysR family regulator